jgi:hypothetical protein
MSHPSRQQLQRAIEITERIERLEAELSQVLGGSKAAAAPASTVSAPGRKKRGMSAAGRAAIATAQRARWAAQKAGSAKTAEAPKKRRKMSAAARAKIAAAQRKRWAAQKAAA